MCVRRAILDTTVSNLCNATQWLMVRVRLVRGLSPLASGQARCARVCRNEARIAAKPGLVAKRGEPTACALALLCTHASRLPPCHEQRTLRASIDAQQLSSATGWSCAMLARCVCKLEQISALKRCVFSTRCYPSRRTTLAGLNGRIKQIQMPRSIG